MGAGQKSGMYYALSPDTGAVVWQTKLGPGGHVGGIHWGAASDGTRVYAGCNNTPGTAWKLPDGTTTTNGLWGAMDAATGKIIWRTAEPNAPMVSNVAGGGNGTVNGPVRVTNGVFFGGAMDAAATMYAFDAATGKLLWHFASGGSVYGGAAISGKSIFWGRATPRAWASEPRARRSTRSAFPESARVHRRGPRPLFASAPSMGSRAFDCTMTVDPASPRCYPHVQDDRFSYL